MMETKKHILVVDDEPAIGKFLRIHLSNAGYEVITTTRGAEAIELIRTQEPDIVLLDIVMPDMTGIEVLSSVRAFSQLPIIVFTGRPEIVQIAKQFGASDYIPKPFNLDLLTEKIRLVLRSNNVPGNDEHKKDIHPG
jgi:two-component system, OmpR family, KDP operon response regulator KdpE